MFCYSSVLSRLPSCHLQIAHRTFRSHVISLFFSSRTRKKLHEEFKLMMNSDEIPGNEDADDVLPLPPTPTTPVGYSRTVSQNLRDLDDALTHAIDQLTTFNNETMSDLTLKYELVRKNEV